jgi:hypothetical protein
MTASDTQTLMQKHNTKKQGNVTPSKVNSSTIMDSSDNEMDETSKNSKKLLMKLKQTQINA